jgi:hypothetical protein
MPGSVHRRDRTPFGASASRRSWLLAAAVTALSPATAGAAPSAWIADEGVRVLRDRPKNPAARAEGSSVWRPGGELRLHALRGEVVAFQVVVEAEGDPAENVTVELAAFAGGTTIEAPRAHRFVEHYVEVAARSRNEQRPNESLGWLPAARPPDEEHLGWVPDALVPIELATTWCPYPMRVPAGQTRAVWVDVAVPEAAAADDYRSEVRVRAGEAAIATIPLTVTVIDTPQPFRAASVLLYYDPEELERRVGEVDVPERQLWQLLRAHQIDALPAGLTSAAAAKRLAPMLDGSLFTEARGYRGPGLGQAPLAVAVGMYGALGDPRPESLKAVAEVLPLIPAPIEDVLLYAVDESCKSPRGPAWRAALRADPTMSRVRAAHTCSEDPRRQDVDLVLMAAQGFDVPAAIEARAQGRGVWIYNGQLPHAGPLMLDAHPVSLTANGWIAAAYDIGRWFYWESTFWEDGNRGGRGPKDPFVTAETFHNADGDSCLYDGLLLYPGKQVGAFAEHSLGLSGVIPSMRLKAIRRGIQDAGLLALARAAAPARADAVLARIVPAALSYASAQAPTPFATGAAEFAAARAELRSMIVAGASPDPKTIQTQLREAAALRERAAQNHRDTEQRRIQRTWWIRAAAALTIAIAALLGVLFWKRSSTRRQ